MADSAAHPGAEILEDHAEGRIKTLYDDIKATLRVPVVNLVFRVLAAQYPDYLQVAWRTLQPNAQTAFFEMSSDELRRRAVAGVAEFEPAPPRTLGAEVTDIVRVFHYVNPKLLLAVGALRAALNGQEPRLQELSRDEKRQIERGVPVGAPTTRQVDLEEADDRVRGIFDDIRLTLGLSVINSDYRALASRPDDLETLWSSLKPHVDSPRYGQIVRELRSMTRAHVSVLPFRMDLNPHTLRHSGLSEQQLDGLRTTLSEFYGLLPGLVVNTAFFAVATLGRDEALRSPYPLAVPAR